MVVTKEGAAMPEFVAAGFKSTDYTRLNWTDMVDTQKQGQSIPPEACPHVNISQLQAPMQKLSTIESVAHFARSALPRKTAATNPRRMTCMSGYEVLLWIILDGRVLSFAEKCSTIGINPPHAPRSKMLGLPRIWHWQFLTR